MWHPVREIHTSVSQFSEPGPDDESKISKLDIHTCYAVHEKRITVTNCNFIKVSVSRDLVLYWKSTNQREFLKHIPLNSLSI